MPDDIHTSIWASVIHLIEQGHVAVTTEIYTEMLRIPGMVGASIKANRGAMVLEVEAKGWDWQSYVRVARDLQERYRGYIAEWNNNRVGTVGLNDVSIVALAKTLGLPLVSMEKAVLSSTSSRRTIPNLCRDQGVEHLDFNTFLRRAGISA